MSVPSLLEREALTAGLTPSTRLGIGCARLGAFWQGRSVREGSAALQAVLDSGVNLVDTADCYARGLSERIVGRATRGRDTVVITKAGLVKTPAALWTASRSGPQAGISERLSGLKPGPETGRSFAPGYLRTALNASVRRLGRAPDILLLHEPPADVIEADEPAETMKSLRQSGNVRAVGVSVRDLAATRAALAASWVDVVEAPVPVLAELGPEAAASRAGIIALAVLADGAHLSAPGIGVDLGEVAVGLAADAVALPGVDAVLLGMSRLATARANIAALRALEGGAAA